MNDCLVSYMANGMDITNDSPVSYMANSVDIMNDSLVSYMAKSMDITQPPQVALNATQPASVWNTHQCNSFCAQ